MECISLEGKKTVQRKWHVVLNGGIIERKHITDERRIFLCVESDVASDESLSQSSAVDHHQSSGSQTVLKNKYKIENFSYLIIIWIEEAFPIHLLPYHAATFPSDTSS